MESEWDVGDGIHGPRHSEQKQICSGNMQCESGHGGKCGGQRTPGQWSEALEHHSGEWASSCKAQWAIGSLQETEQCWRYAGGFERARGLLGGCCPLIPDRGEEIGSCQLCFCCCYWANNFINLCFKFDSQASSD